jgi:transporter family protein
MNWTLYAVLSAVFGALVAIFGKIGVRDVDSNLAVALRTVIIVCFAWGIVLVQGNAREVFRISRHSYLFLFLSALATGCSWLCYYKALKLGPASRVAPIDKLSVALAVALAFVFLGEKPTVGNVLGAVLITAGVLVAALVRRRLAVLVAYAGTSPRGRRARSAPCPPVAV